MREYIISHFKTFIKNGRKGKAAGAAAVILLLAVCLLMGGRKTPDPGRLQEEETTLQEEETAPEPLPVSGEEENLLSGLYKAMEQKRLTEAAEILNENEEAFKTLVQETLKGEKYCYYEETAGEEKEFHRMEPLPEEGKGKGLVVTRYNTVFFGEFLDGAPEGDCMAVQAMVLNGMRYTYAAGKWAGGKMNGEGKTGYYCYENAPESSFVITEKTGVYKDNLIDGSFTYRTETGDGESLHWEMEAEDGVTVLSDGWTYYDYRNAYMLPSMEDAARAYVLTKEQTNAVLWNNLILWDE